MTKSKNNRKIIINPNKKTKKHRKHIFTEEDYRSGDGMMTTIWGPCMWHFLHTMSFNYPVDPSLEEKKKYREFVMDLQYTLPCKYCRENLKKNLKELPLTMETMKDRDSFSRYMYELHETINKMLNKKSHLSYEDVRERYEHFRSRCTDKKPQNKIRVVTLLQNTKPTNTNNKTRRKKEKGCTQPLYGKKSKCVIKIVPQEEDCPTFQIDKKSILTRD